MKNNQLLFCIFLSLFHTSCFKPHADPPEEISENYKTDEKSQAKIVLCHVPPDDTSNKVTITVGEAAVDAHLAHGDYNGECASSSDAGSSSGSGSSGGYHPTISGCGTSGFGFNGSVTLPNLGNSHIYIRALTLRPDCSIVVGGPIGYTDAESDFGVAGITTSGSLDTSFGTNGQTRTNVSIYSDGWDSLRSLAVAPSGRFAAMGYSTPGSALVRYVGTGLLDPNFQSSGIFRSASSKFLSVAYYDDGKFLESSGSALTRHNADGSVDMSYGTNGTQSGFGDELYILSNGKSLAGRAANSVGYCHLEVERRNYDGSIDSSFGAGGVGSISLTTALTCNLSALAVGSNGKIFIGGYKGHTAIIGRLNADGTTDTAFGAQGTVVSNIVSVAYGLLPQSDGKVIYGGSQHMSRLNTDGSTDTSFGESGDVFFGATVEDHSMALQPDGKIVVGLYSPGKIVRYNSNGTLDVP